TSSATAGEDDVVVAADTLIAICAKSPEVVHAFMRHVTPATIVQSINWDLIHAGNSTKDS
ncbi:hypothetical protein E2562_006939, partial [Oryza meyeriana var. granulata]